MAWGPAAGDTVQVSFLVDKPRSFSLNLTALGPLRQLVRILQDHQRSFRFSFSFMDEPRSRSLATGEPPQRELQGVLGSLS